MELKWLENQNAANILWVLWRYLKKYIFDSKKKPGKKQKSQVTLTNTEDVEAESMVDRLVDQLVRHAVKPNMSSQRDSSSTLPLQNKEKWT